MLIRLCNFLKYKEKLFTPGKRVNRNKRGFIRRHKLAFNQDIRQVRARYTRL